MRPMQSHIVLSIKNCFKHGKEKTSNKRFFNPKHCSNKLRIKISSLSITIVLRS